MSDKEIVTEVPEVPATVLRPVRKDLDQKIPQPGLVRATKAVSTEHPEGSKYALPEMEKMTVLQNHIWFWDRDRDGVIWPWDTYVGFRNIGFGYFISVVAVFFINVVAFSYATCPSWLPDIFFRIWVKRIHKGKHGSDSGVYDTEGRFTPQKFEELFTKFGKKVNEQDGFYLKDVGQMCRSHMVAFDPFGWTAERLEWYAFWYIAHDKNNFVSKEKVRAMYDGTLWWQLAEDTKQRRNRPGFFKNKYSKQALKADKDL